MNGAQYAPAMHCLYYLAENSVSQVILEILAIPLRKIRPTLFPFLNEIGLTY